MDLDRLARVLAPRSRRAAVAALAAVALPASARGETAPRRKRRNPCSGKNWCVDRSQTCGPSGASGRCMVKAFGGNVCAEILFQADDCAACTEPVCANCVCALAAGGGDRCNNGVNGKDFICVRPL